MSRRALRKLKGDSQLSSELKLNSQSESDEGELKSVQNKKKEGIQCNPYELLSQDQTPSDNEAKEDDDVEVDENGALENDEKSHNATDSLKRKKKKKRKKQKDTKDEDDIDATIEEVNKLLGDNHLLNLNNKSIERAEQASSEKSIFNIDYRNLNPENELKRIFGSKVVQGDLGKRKPKGRNLARSSRLVSPKQSWPQVGKSGIKMNLVETKNDVHYFCFEHSTRYQQIQFEFLDAVESANPANIVNILNSHPYHIDALLQLSDIVRLGEDVQMAMDLIARALYCFECSFHPLFNLAKGNCKLDYKFPENRGFLIAIFKHLVFIGQRGCHRTALEFCKLLIGLCSTWDPLGTLLLVDFYAIRAGEYEYLKHFFNELDPQRNLSLLPNFTYSMALVEFHLAKQENKPMDEADARLQDALIKFPEVLTPLLEKCSIQTDPVVKKHDFFGPQVQLNMSLGLKQLVDLYVLRCYFLWKEPEILPWLETNVHKALARVDKKDPLVAEWEAKRKTCFGRSAPNVYRHIILTGVEGVSLSLQSSQSNPTLMSFDPWPPSDNCISYTRPPKPPSTATEDSMLTTFLNCILPSYSIEAAMAGANQDGRQARPPAAEGGAVAQTSATSDLRWSVTSLLDAMRDLLSNIHFPDQAQDGDDDDDDDDDDNDNN